MTFFSFVQMDPPKNSGAMLPKDHKVFQDFWWGEYDLVCGKKIENWNDRNVAFFERDGEKSNLSEDYLGTTLPCPVISRKFKELLERERIENIQFFPIRIENFNNPSDIFEAEYFIVNILDVVVGAIDKKKSISDWIGWFLKKTLIEKKISGHDWFRLFEDPFQDIISERIKRLFEDNCSAYVKFSRIMVVEHWD